MDAQCSFCTKPSDAVATLVAGPGVCICDECVCLCTTLLEGKPASLPQLEPWQTVDDVDTVLATLPKIAAAAEQVEASLVGWVGRARALGASWALVGEALGMTRQSAWERFAAWE